MFFVIPEHHRLRALLIGMIFLMGMAETVTGQIRKASLHFDQLTIQDKLSHNTVRCLMQDHCGYIWIGTQNGLNKYDGYTFEVFRSDTHPPGGAGFLGKNISAMLEDRHGNLWVGTSGEGINLMPVSRRQFVNLKRDSAFSAILGYEISSLFEDSAGNIWVTTIGGGVLRFDPRTRQSSHYTSANSGLSSDLVFDLVEDDKGGIWVGAAGLGVNYLERNQRFSQRPEWTPGEGNLAGYRKTLLADGGFLWVGTEGTGLYKLNLSTLTVTHLSEGPQGLNSNGVMDLHKTREGELLIATNGGGLNILDISSGSVRGCVNQSGDPGSLNSNALLCLLEDRSENLWIGTFNGGMNIHQPGKTYFEFLTTHQIQDQRLENWSVLALQQLRSGEILAGTDGYGLFRLSREAGLQHSRQISRHPVNESLSGSVIKSVLEDQSGKIWVGTFSNGLNCYDPATQRTKTYRHEYWNPTSLGGDNVWSIDEDHQGNIWIGTLGGGLTMWNPREEAFTVFGADPDNPASLSDANVMVTLVDSRNQVWAGTMGKGLDLWLGEGNAFRHFRFDPDDPQSLSNDEVRAIFEDSRGGIWIGTEGGGLNRWLGEGKFERLGKDQGLLANSVMAITEDQKGNLWVSTFEGVSCLDAGTGSIRNFNFRESRSSNQFNQQSVLAASDGQLLFGGIKGIHAIDPDELASFTTEPQIILTGFSLFNERVMVGPREDGRILLEEPIEFASQVNLDYSDNSFTFSFAATDFGNPGENKFSYKMGGFDQDWRETAPGQHQASYTNLEPASYTFRVKHLGQEKSIQVIIAPPFWKTIWFRAGVALLGLGLAFGAGYFVIKRREAAFREQALQANSEILRLHNEKMAAEVEAVNSRLVFSAAQMAHKNEILTRVKEEIRQISGDQKQGAKQLIRMLNRELEGEDYWKEFNLYFNQVDKDFIQSLSTRHPDLTSNDLRLCALIRLNLTTKEIASLLNITVRGVEQGRYRLKKRLDLGAEETLGKYISEV